MKEQFSWAQLMSCQEEPVLGISKAFEKKKELNSISNKSHAHGTNEKLHSL